MPAAATLRSNFAWTFAGNLTYAAGQWAILSLFAKLGSAQMLGEYALALAVTAPVVMLSHLNLRAVLATDAAYRHPLGDYLAVRMGATAVSAIAIGGLALARANPLVILAVGVAQLAENVSDLYYGALQRRERMDRIAWSMMARALISAGTVGIMLALTHRAGPAVIGLAAARLAVLLLFDRPMGSKYERRARSSRSAQVAILRTALPLGLVLMLISLNTNLPRYAIEHRLGTRELGAFAAVASLMTAGNTIVNALGQSATPRLARYFQDRNGAAFRRLALQLAGVAGTIGIAGVAGAALLGAPLLSILYRPEYATHAGLLTQTMLAAVPGYLAGMFGYVITATRAFDAQLPLFCAVAASCGAAAWVLIPRYGLPGALASLGIAAGVQIAGELAILARAFRRQERAG